MDVIWLKRDVRLLDHGPFAAAAKDCTPDIKVCVLYLYEPDQLSDPTVHGSHLHFVNEGLYSLDCKFGGRKRAKDFYKDELQYITVGYGECVDIFQKLHGAYPIRKIYAHMETGNMASFQRDIRWRRWCKQNNISFVEFNQTGVTRLLKHRNDFSKRLQQFLSQPMYHDNMDEKFLVKNLREKIILTTDIILSSTSTYCTNTTHGENLKGKSSRLMPPEELVEIPKEHQCDRTGREQFGGEDLALEVLHSFFHHRGIRYNQHISSPNTSWNSCSRLSPYLTWGHISLRYVIQTLQQYKLKIKNTNNSDSTSWKRSLAAFSSRIHWRSHFIQKLECQPNIEKMDLCPAYQSLRRQPGNFNEQYYKAWCTGNTGFPFVDACMRCLLKHGWLNFRMRAMLVSFACWNLWLDWVVIGKHLAKCFLDYEPGIHYPQLQMQAGTTGINAMRVYSVTKQGYDQDPKGIFIKKYIPELSSVPLKFIHEPWKMPVFLQQQLNVYIVDYTKNNTDTFMSNLAKKHENDQNDSAALVTLYSRPIVDEKVSAKLAKDKFAEVRNMASTKQMARAVYIKHGSRNNNQQRQKRNHQDAKVVESLFMENRSNINEPESSPQKNKKTKLVPSQTTLIDLFANRTTANNSCGTKSPSKTSSTQNVPKTIKSYTNVSLNSDTSQVTNDDLSAKSRRNLSQITVISLDCDPTPITVTQNPTCAEKPDSSSKIMQSYLLPKKTCSPSKTNKPSDNDRSSNIAKQEPFWICAVCTFQNEKLLAPVCEMCESKR